MSNIWQRLESNYIKRSAVPKNPHWFIRKHNDVTADHILGNYGRMDIIGKGISGDS